jgi:ABC-type multidrug transport system fused ATPase/permease subunit
MSRARYSLSALTWGVTTLLRQVRAAFVLSLVFALLCGALPAMQPLLSRDIVDRVIGRSPGIGLWLVVAAMGVTFVLPAIVKPIQTVMTARIEDTAVRAVDELLIDAGAAMPDLTRLDRPDVHDAVAELDIDATAARRLPTDAATVIQQVIGVAVVLASLSHLGPVVPCVLLAAAVPHVLGEGRTRKLQFQVMTQHSRDAREMNYCLQTALEPERAKEIRAFGLGAYFSNRFEMFARRALAEMRHVRVRSARTSVLCALAYAAAVVGCFAYVAARARIGVFSIGDLALYLTGIVVLSQELFRSSLSLATAGDTIRRLGHLRGFVGSATAGIEIAEEGVPASPRLTTGVEFSGVTFAYPDASGNRGSLPVLTNLCLRIPAGTLLAVVGENGEGKSTLVKLLTRMYDPVDGSIRLDGRLLAGFDLGSHRSRTATVYQDHARFALTLGENIAVAEPALLEPGASAALRSQRIRAAADAAGVNALADAIGGFEVELTTRFGGVDLSGGQWQRVATGRAFLPDAGLVILDEPTSALDADAERHLVSTFRHLTAGRTAIIISHRLSTVRTADAIAVVADGRIVEVGTHDELMTAAGRYAELFSMQASHYR